MFFLTSKVGTMCAVYDDTDNSVEWVSVDALRGYVEGGTHIEGVSGGIGKPVQGIRLDIDSCCWTPTMKNIFDVADKAVLGGGSVTVYAEGRKYKGKVVSQDSQVCTVLFSNGITVDIPMEWIAAHR